MSSPTVLAAVSKLRIVISLVYINKNDEKLNLFRIKLNFFIRFISQFDHHFILLFVYIMNRAHIILFD